MGTRHFLPLCVAVLVGGRAVAGDRFYTVLGQKADEYFGHSVSSAGDVNRDGYPDLVVGAPGPFLGLGQARVLSGRDGSVIWQWSGLFTFGQAVAGAGDINADQFPDVIVGVAGGVRVYSGKTGAEIFTDAATGLGSAVSGAGDVNH